MTPEPDYSLPDPYPVRMWRIRRQDGSFFEGQTSIAETPAGVKFHLDQPERFEEITLTEQERARHFTPPAWTILD